MIIGNVRVARHMLPESDWKAEDQREDQARTSGGNNNGNDNQGGDMPSWMFKEESNKGKAQNRDSKKKPAQIKKNVMIQEGTTEGKCVAGPCLTRAQAKKTNKIHLLQVKETTSSVDKSTIENLQKKDSTLKK